MGQNRPQGMMAFQMCATCRYWAEEMEAGSSSECHRYPPGRVGWPKTWGNQGCGDWAFGVPAARMEDLSLTIQALEHDSGV